MIMSLACLYSKLVKIDNISKKHSWHNVEYYSFMCKKLALIPQSESIILPHHTSITSRVDDDVYIHKKKSFSWGLPTLRKKFKASRFDNWIHHTFMYISIWLRNCHEPQVFYRNQQTKKYWDTGHQQELPQAKVVFNLWGSSDYEKGWWKKTQKNKDFNYTLRRSVALMTDIRLPEYHSSQIRWWQSQNWSLEWKREITHT